MASGAGNLQILCSVIPWTVPVATSHGGRNEVVSTKSQLDCAVSRDSRGKAITIRASIRLMVVDSLPPSSFSSIAMKSNPVVTGER